MIFMKRKNILNTFCLIAGMLTLSYVTTGCSRKGSGQSADGKKSVEIKIKGSDTMIQLTTSWAEEYRKIAPHVQISAFGGGSGTGIAALQNGTTDLCSSSRDIKPEEREKIKKATGKEVKEIVVAFDALAIYVHKENPMKEISIEELREIWAENGSLTNWSQLGGMASDIVLVGRQNNSGTYDYFREHIAGKNAEGKQRELKAGISELNGSAEVIETIAKTKSAIGYSGMGYKNDSLNWLAVSNKKGESAVTPNIETTKSGQYPISRKLFIYAVGEPTGDVKEFIDWVSSAAGQAAVAKEHFVPVSH
jgi:phosphate transport system substrate-binding protein